MGKIVGFALMPHPLAMVSEIGRVEIKNLQKTIKAAEQTAQRIKEENPQTVILMTPHGQVCPDAVTIAVQPRVRGHLAEGGVHEVNLGFDCDIQFVNQLIIKADKYGINPDKSINSSLDYGALVPLYFLHKAGYRGSIVYLSIGLLLYEEMYTLGKLVQALIHKSDKKVAVIASGNLSHRLTEDAPGGYHVQAQLFDEKVVHSLKTVHIKDLLQLEPTLIENAGECGLRSIFFLMGTMGGLQVEADLLSYERPLGVGYAVAHYQNSK